jgi:ribosomal protein S18 acetylase RimI-like enzyme
MNTDTSLLTPPPPPASARGGRPKGHGASVNHYDVGGVSYRRARPEDDADLRALLRDNAMQGWVALSLEREPSYFLGEGLMGPAVSVIARDLRAARRPVGMYSCTALPVHVNGRATQVGYLAGLRVDPAYRHRLRVVRHGFASVDVLAPRLGDAPFRFTSIASDNEAARRLLEAELPGMPVYRPAGEMETLAFSTRHGRERGLLTPARAADVPALVRFYNRQARGWQLAPVLTADWLLGLRAEHGLALEDFWLLREDGVIRACLAVWDQRAFKQVTARAYRFPLGLLRYPYNSWAAVTGRMALPAPGQRLEQAFLAFFAVDPAAQDRAVDVIRAGLYQVARKGARVGVLGLSTTHALLPLLRARLHPHSLTTCIETVSAPASTPPRLDTRPLQPEVAVL